LPKRALSASATCPAGTIGIDAVVLVLPEFGTTDCAGGVDGIGRLLGPKISPRVAGTGEIRPVDGVAENNEFCAMAIGEWIVAKTSTTAGRSRPHRTAVAGVQFIASLFSAEIEAISSQPPRCLLAR
jgi:hypothetical protein